METKGLPSPRCTPASVGKLDMRTQRKRPMLAIQKGVQKRGRGTRESPENRTPRAKNGVPVHIRNALSSDYVHVTSEEASDWQLIVHKVKSVYSNHDIVFLDEWGVIDGKDCKVATFVTFTEHLRMRTPSGCEFEEYTICHESWHQPSLAASTAPGGGTYTYKDLL
eukprot:1331560-Amorphochlora_amoeboformis.AAC.2